MTQRQRYWLRHIRAAERKNEPLTVYAEQRGLSVSSLYEAKHPLRKDGFIEAASGSRKPERATPEFVRVSILVAEELELDPFSTQVFAFYNRKRNQVKFLVWERNGFALWQKRLEKDRSPWPRSLGDEVVALTGRELNWLLDGIDVFTQKPHEELSFSSVG